MKKRQARGPRSRDGCIPCKAKHKACDEGKPWCQNCLAKNTICHYSGTIKKFIGGTSRRGELRIDLAGTPEERRLLNFFIKKTTTDFTSLFTSDIWLRTILQIGVNDSPLRHAITAIGSIHFSFLQQERDVTPRASLVPSYFALSQYGLAIQQLRQSIAQGTCHSLLALLCCAMFMLFDSFRGASLEAIMHLSNGARILYSLSSAEGGPGVVLDKTLLYSLRHLFMRVAIQIKFEVKDLVSDSNDQASIITELGVIFDMISNSTASLARGHSFTSLEDARDSLNEIIIMAYANFYQSSPLYRHRDKHHWSHLRQLRFKMLANFGIWDESFAAYTNSENFLHDQKTHNAALLLRMCWQSTYNQFAILLHTDSNGASVLDDQAQWRFLSVQSPPSSNPVTPSTTLTTTRQPSSDSLRNLFLDHTPRFQIVLDFAEELLGSQIPQPIAGQTLLPADTLIHPYPSTTTAHAQAGIPEFYPDIGIISEVYISGMLCCEMLVRERAISILSRHNRREGGWDSHTCAEALKNLTIQEQDMSQASIIERASYGAF